MLFFFGGGVANKRRSIIITPKIRLLIKNVLHIVYVRFAIRLKIV